MKPMQARLVAVLASYLAALLASRGIAVLGADGTALLEQALSQGFDLVLLLGYALLHPQLQACRWPPFSKGVPGAPDEGRQP